jgi:type IV fimbrial biogenesis protein FimT
MTLRSRHDARPSGTSMQTHRRLPGFTLVEMMTTIAVAAILVAMAVPSFAGLAERNRLRNVAERLRSDVNLARTEALRRDRNVTLSFTRSGDGTTWCYGLTTAANCDCTVASGAGACELDPGVSTRVLGSETRGVVSSAVPFGDGNLSFTAARSTLLAGSARFQSPSGLEARVVVLNSGRVRLCSPAGTAKLFYFEACE